MCLGLGGGSGARRAIGGCCGSRHDPQGSPRKRDCGDEDWYEYRRYSGAYRLDLLIVTPPVHSLSPQKRVNSNHWVNQFAESPISMVVVHCR